METKNENDNRKELAQNEEPTSGAPGQVLPEKSHQDKLNKKQTPGSREEHSASSLPEKDNETLGTP